MRHPLVPAKTTFFTDRGWEVRGVVHVGAHEGQEIPWYLHMGHVPVLAFEPNPKIGHRLAIDFAGEIRDGLVRVFITALGEHTGNSQFWIPRHLHDDSDDSQSASFLRADHDSSYAWGERDHDGRWITVHIWRFDEWAKPTGLSHSHNEITLPMLDLCNTLVIDVQGYELQVLRGFGKELDRFENLIVECSTTPIYLGEAPAIEVVSYLDRRGFEQLTALQGHDDILFRRRGL